MLRYPLIENTKDNPLWSEEIPHWINCQRSTNLPFDIEKNNWIPVDNFADADVIPITLKVREKHEEHINFLKKIGIRPDQLLLVMHIWDDTDTYDWTSLFYEFKQRIREHSSYRVVLVHNNHNGFKHGLNEQESIHWNHMWNRTKAYYTDYDNIDLRDKIYTFYATKKCWQLNPIHKTENAKIFLCPNRIFPFISPRLAYRKMLKLILENQNGYMSVPHENKLLEPEEPDLISSWSERNHYGGGHWWPIANKYYENSFVSIFVETITTNGEWYIQNPWRAISEKSYDPLIKGHFILPFGYTGLIEDLTKIGFRFPSWINYDYDKIQDNNFRFAGFLEETKRLLTTPIDQYYEYYEKDRNILEHNRQLFYTLPYSQLYEQVKKIL